MRIYIGLISLLLWMCACDTPENSKSELFYEVFLNDSSVFRNLEPGDPIEDVSEKEEETPSHSDDIGLVFEYSLSSGYILYLDYWSDKLNSGNPQNKIASIVANILIDDEVQTAKLYNEIVNHFNALYGISSGAYGNFSWQGITQKSTAMEVFLKLEESKKGVTINFVDTEPIK
ncbi:MAG: hypothetical protein MRZ79_00675 [Bacteroidia bacterium]|nr:hypothetical protein [Bacteroidia bacterium]